MAHRCRKVWPVMGLVTPALRTASFAARGRTDSCTWWRRKTRARREPASVGAESEHATAGQAERRTGACASCNGRRPRPAARRAWRLNERSHHPYLTNGSDGAEVLGWETS